MNESLAALQTSVTAALAKIAQEKGIQLPETCRVEFERPKDESHGDWATNVAMKCAKILGTRPRDLAERLTSLIDDSKHIASMEVAGPGFINFRLSNQWMDDLVARIAENGENYGKSSVGAGRSVQVEFVSANPTGPLHVGHGRGAAVGDVVGNILAFAGWKVEKEYYVNDAGLQINILAKSILARYFELQGCPEKLPFDDSPGAMYKGAYIYDEARRVIEAVGDKFVNSSQDEALAYLRRFGAQHILENIKSDLARFGVKFNQFFSEKSLYERDLVRKAVETLREAGFVYEKDGALWYRSTDFGDDKDRVLFRSTGEPTYFASDVAYHKEKFDRGFDRVIDVWGCDHHGYVPRINAALRGLGKDAGDFNVLLIQFVNLVKDGQIVGMSTRGGKFETLASLLDEVGVDAARYYFLMRRSDSQLDFDMDQAKRESSDNPVYYVQYAYARIASLTRKAQEKNIDMTQPLPFDGRLMTSPEEKRLLTALETFPGELERAAAGLEPHLLVTYVHELSGHFHAFYNSCRILDEDEPLRSSHLALVQAVRTVLKNCFGILGFSAPERM